MLVSPAVPWLSVPPPFVPAVESVPPLLPLPALELPALPALPPEGVFTSELLSPPQPTAPRRPTQAASTAP
jgi:hypothetical protein